MPTARLPPVANAGDQATPAPAAAATRTPRRAAARVAGDSPTLTKLAVIDDDPTGAQSEAGVPLLLDWPAAALRGREAAGAVHLLTNSRALAERDAYRIARDAAAAALAGMPERRVVLRGDSTLRGHVLAEYEAVRDAAFAGRDPTLVLVPALPAAGRVTVGGVHWLERDGARVPLAETEYARDRAFGYSRSGLLEWAEERTAGHFRADAGRELPLSELREPGGADAFVAALRELGAAGRPAVLVPDAERLGDLQVIAAGLRAAWDAGVEIVVRCGPALVGVAAGTSAVAPVATPVACRGTLVIAGSYVHVTTRQLDALVARHPRALVELDAALLAAAGSAAAAIDAAVRAARARLASDGLAIVATTRETPTELLAPAPGMRIAEGLARVLARTRDVADIVVSKGGITSAVAVRSGFGAHEALVVGPLADGIALWRVLDRSGEPAQLVVFPGNVGDTGSLADLVDRLQGG
jgi:uncharacterized protein YgbK (DUF1537 family)